MKKQDEEEERPSASSSTPLLTVQQGLFYLMLGFSLSWLLAAAMPASSSSSSSVISSSSAPLTDTITSNLLQPIIGTNHPPMMKSAVLETDHHLMPKTAAAAAAAADDSSTETLRTLSSSRRRRRRLQEEEEVETNHDHNDHNNAEQETSPTLKIPRVQFIFTMGLLGDGKLHEFLGQVVSESPAMQRLVDLGIAPNPLVKLHRLLYQTTTSSTEEDPTNNMSPGLWNAHCVEGDGKSKTMTTTKSKTKAKKTTKSKTKTVSAAELHRQVVALLQEIQAIVTEAYTSGKAVMEDPNDPRSHVIPIPINTLLMTTTTSTSTSNSHHHNATSSSASTTSAVIESKFGHMTYPTEFSKQSCFRLDFASLDLWYSACQEAHVDCRHLLAHRPPLLELRQTFTRLAALREKSYQEQKQKNKKKTTAPPRFYRHLAVLHHYNTMLHIMADEMVQFAPRNIGCLDTSTEHWKDLWFELWGYHSSNNGNADAADDDSSNRRNMLAVGDGAGGEDGEDDTFSVFFPRSDIPREGIESVLPTTTAPYVESFLQLHRNAAQTCTDTLQQVHAFLQQREEAKERV